MEKTLIILRGVSGAGKSTVAELLKNDSNVPHYEADMFHYVDGEYQWKQENQHKAHEWCQKNVRLAMDIGYDRVIVSNTSTSEKEIKPYLDLANDYGYQVVSLVVENRHGNDSIHSVPQETRDAQERRLRNSLKLQ